MSHIVILSASVRQGRQSHHVALYFNHYLEENNIGSNEIIDLKDYQFPVFEERLKFLESPDAGVLEFAEKIQKADGIIIVTPEYNGGYPASLKNVIDLLYAEWYKKPVGIVTVSDGVFGGTQVITSLQFTLWKMKAWTIPAMFPVPNVSKSFDAQGVPVDKDATDKRAAGFVKELVWCMDSNQRMKES